MMDNDRKIELIENVNRGANFLDDIKPDWFNLIDIDKLDLSDGNVCICGQVFMEEALEKIGPIYNGFAYALNNIDGLAKNSSSYGFCASNPKEYDYLAMVWIEKIEKRRAEEGTML